MSEQWQPEQELKGKSRAIEIGQMVLACRKSSKRGGRRLLPLKKSRWNKIQKLKIKKKKQKTKTTQISQMGRARGPAHEVDNDRKMVDMDTWSCLVYP